MKEASALYRLLGDEARLRLVRVLDKDRFNVKELTGILGLAQSGVSRHLGLLKESELVVEERDGAYSFYRLSPAVKDNGNSPLWPLLQSQFDAAAGSAMVKADESRLQEVLRLRRENFEHVGPDTRDGRQLVPGRSWAARSRALGISLPPAHAAAPRRSASGSCREEAGPRGRARWACCCRRSTSRISAAAKGISRSRPRAGRN